MLMSTRARIKFNTLLETAASHAARHYSPKLQELYEVHVFEAALAFVDQITEDDYEAAEGSSDGPEAPF
jgi:hypothetical protein